MLVPPFGVLVVLELCLLLGSPALGIDPPRSTGQATEENLTPQALEAIWSDLRRDDADGTKRAYQHICLLIRHPWQAVPFLKDRLKPVPRPDPIRTEHWIADLDSNDFVTREKASTELEKLGPLARPALSKKLESRLSSLEVRRRLERILAKVDSRVPSAEELRALRAMEVLEGIGTAEARQLIATLASGAAGAGLTEDAKRGLSRLEKQATSKP
jgi:hypothetical protein